MAKTFWAAIEALGTLEVKLQERGDYWEATQIKVIRGFLSAIMIGHGTK